MGWVEIDISEVISMLFWLLLILASLKDVYKRQIYDRQHHRRCRCRAAGTRSGKSVFFGHLHWKRLLNMPETCYTEI